MPREAPAAHSLRRAAAALEEAASCLMAMRAGAMDPCRERLEQASAVLDGLCQSGIPAEQKRAARDAARLLQQRMEALRALALGFERLVGIKPAAHFQTYTANGEAETSGAPGNLLFEL